MALAPLATMKPATMNGLNRSGIMTGMKIWCKPAKKLIFSLSSHPTAPTAAHEWTVTRVAKFICILLAIAFTVAGWVYADAGHYFFTGVCLTLAFVCGLGAY